MRVHGNGGKCGPMDNRGSVLAGLLAGDRPRSAETATEFRDRCAFRYRRGLLTGRRPSLVRTRKEG